MERAVASTKLWEVHGRIIALLGIATNSKALPEQVTPRAVAVAYYESCRASVHFVIQVPIKRGATMATHRIIVFCVLLTAMASALAQQDPSADCFINLASDSRFTPISGKMAIGAPPKSTFTMLADESFPSDSERKLIADWATAVEDCGPLGESYRQNNYPPHLLALVNESKNIFVGMVIDLYNRKIPYGQFNRRRQSTFDEIRARATEIVQRLQAQQQAQQEAQQQAQQQSQEARYQAQQAQQAQEDANNRQTALYLLNQMRMNQPRALVPYQMRTRPSTTTNCHWIGDFLNCTTQ